MSSPLDKYTSVLVATALAVAFMLIMFVFVFGIITNFPGAL